MHPMHVDAHTTALFPTGKITNMVVQDVSFIGGFVWESAIDVRSTLLHSTRPGSHVIYLDVPPLTRHFTSHLAASSYNRRCQTIVLVIVYLYIYYQYIVPGHVTNISFFKFL